MRRAFLVLFVSLVVTLFPRDAAAGDERWVEPVALGMLEVALGTALTGSVALASVAAESPDTGWGRASLGFGAGQAAIGATFMVLGAVYDDTFAWVVGGIGVGLGVFGLTAGTITEIAVPPQDPGIPGQPRPMPTMFTWQGSF